MDTTGKTIDKEDRNMFILSFPFWLRRLIQNLHMTPQGILCKIGKIQYWFGMEVVLLFCHSQDININIANKMNEK